MESSLQLQMNVRNNAQELQNYMLDLNNWEEEMKRKEAQLNKEKFPECDVPPPRNKIKKSESNISPKFENKAKKISAYDYSAWDKFDVEKACAEIDKEDTSKNKESEPEISKEESSSSEDEEEKKNENEKKLALVDEAFYEKEMGNQFVKKEQWDSAIKCYTNAINLDSKNPIFYANRSLCFLKLKNFKAAETDATVAIQLDKNYVKAYQRRAFVRLALGQLLEAKADYEEVLRLEPKNALARVEIDKIDKALSKSSKTKPVVKKKTFNHKDLFKSEENKINKPQLSQEKSSSSKDISKSDSFTPVKKVRTPVKVEEKMESSLKEIVCSNKGNGDAPSPQVETKKKTNVFKPLPEWCKLVQPINIPPHKRSKKPLRKINIVNVYEDVDAYFQEETPGEPDFTEKKEKKEEKGTTIKAIIPSSTMEKEKLSFDTPKTAIQFQNCWKVLKTNSDEAYSYLKKIQGSKLPLIFENSLESDFFSDLVTFLANDKVTIEPDFMCDFLLGLSQVKRFSTLVLFMSNQDQNCIRKCISNLEKVKSKEEISYLMKLYEL